MKCSWCEYEQADEQLYRCFHCKTLVCEACGPRHFGDDHGHAELAQQAAFWKMRATSL